MDNVQNPRPVQISRDVWGTAAVQILNWLVVPGEMVAEGDILLEVGVPGMLGDVRAPVAGRVEKICLCEDAWVTGDTILGWLEPLSTPEDE